MSDVTFTLTQQALLKNSERFKRRIESKLSYQFSIPVLFTISKLPTFRIFTRTCSTYTFITEIAKYFRIMPLAPINMRIYVRFYFTLSSVPTYLSVKTFQTLSDYLPSLTKVVDFPHFAIPIHKTLLLCPVIR